MDQEKELTTEELNKHLKEYLAYKGINFNKEHATICLNPTHIDHRPSMHLKDNFLKCFSCNRKYTLIDLVILDYCLSDDERQTLAEDSGNFEADKIFLRDAKKQAQAISIIKNWLATGTFKNIDTSLLDHQEPSDKIRNYEGYLKYLSSEAIKKDAEEPLRAYLQDKRGISPSTYKYFHIFYEARQKNIIFFKFNSRYILEKDSNPKIKGYIVGYNSRSTEEEAETPKRAVVDYQTIYDNLNMLNNGITGTTPLIICEGEIDLLSIYEILLNDASKHDLGTCKGHVIALSGVNNINALINAIKITNATNKLKLILALDNDKVGKASNKELAKLCKENGIKYTTKQIVNSKYKDANEELLQSKEQLKEDILNAIENIDYYISHEEEIAKEQEAEQETSQEQEAQKEADSEAERQRQAYLLDAQAFNYLEAFKQQIQENKSFKAIQTRFKSLDQALDGGLTNGLITIGAISSLGKTTLALQIADQIAQTNAKDILIFSLEQSKAEIIAKSLSRLSYLRCNKEQEAKTINGILKGTFTRTNEEQALFSECLKDYKAYANNIYIIEGLGNFGIKEIKQTINRHIEATGKTPIIIIDYLQLITPSEKHLTDKQAVDINIMELKRITRDYKTPLIAISSLNRASYNGVVDLSSFKDSGNIEYSSDILIGLNFASLKDADNKQQENQAKQQIKEAKAQDTRKITLEILKNRNGKTGTKINFNYYCKFNLFMEEGTGKDFYISLLDYARKQEAEKQKIDFDTYYKFNIDDKLPF